MEAFEALASLAHLTEITLVRVIMYPNEFLDHPLPTFAGMRSVTIKDLYIRGAEPRGAAFCRSFAEMFPNLLQLQIKKQFPQAFDLEPHLGLFRNLRKHRIWY